MGFAMTFRVRGLPSTPFQHLFGLSDDDLAALHVQRHVADTKPSFPDRIELRDAEAGESVLLVNYTHQPAVNAYRASHAIFVLEGAVSTYDRIGEIPEAMRMRTLSLRAFDSNDMMIDADLVDGREVDGLIERLFSAPDTAYIHAHYARRGCYAARIDRG